MKIAPTYVPSTELSASTQHHLSTHEISLLKHAPSAVTIRNHTVYSVYSVYDKYARRMGLVVKASYMNEKAQTWFAISPAGLVSTALIKDRAEAIRTLEVMWASHLLSSDGWVVASPLINN